ncbi:hypothetical protein FNV43_RR17877 [Rhamnella rubrinervis]|uniref:ADP-ribosyl cyclase/cyclic ADP-ribose hydrolase n=1 Tax=Rhamnella rubrinervis TaxID=2594499 RepID=A0A8K0GV84_9ROSA|nr:hypothetical protein FNV43_RR17877 [Rhamnella rubrinervis]
METNPSSSASSSSPPAKSFDVFLSFRGPDTRNNFTGYLFLALRKIGICITSEDDYALHIGEDRVPELMKAIEESQYAVVVLSENFATSIWCLKELAKIVECMGDSGRIRTIFYHVNPSHVRNVISSDIEKQKESSFWKALEVHAKNPRHSKELESWRNALVKVAYLFGHTVEVHTDEAIFIEHFVANISRELGLPINPSTSSSFASSPLEKRFDVFLSFRGEDTRNNFTGHLSLALRKIGLCFTSKDDYALHKGKDIVPELMKAIEDSQYAVVVLSENFATSIWCLKELAKIVECMGDSRRIWTIFYHVNPSHVRNVISSDIEKQKESSFWKALEGHAKNLSHPKELESWRNALFEVAYESGHSVEVHTDEAIFIEDFVANISSKLGVPINPSTSSSFSSSPLAKRFDVFLSFEEGTRNNFTDHLSLALRKIGSCITFKDSYALHKGKDIVRELMKAIEDSQYAVVVLSENFATSIWCLKELAKIVECMGDSGRIRTIFYHVNPSHVRNVISSDIEKQKESSFWKALEGHAKNPSHSKELESWRNALVEVANRAGYIVEAHMDEEIFIKEFVANISSELGASIRTTEGLFGMTSRLKELDSYVLQSLDTDNVCFLGIHGVGGIGKSTLARAYYKRMSDQFDGASFLQNVKEVCEKKENGLVHLQKQLLKDILKADVREIRYVDNGIDMIRSRLRYKKVLIILDNVSKLEHLNGLTGEDKWFGKGSIIIVTSREDSFLKIRRFNIYRMESLNAREALQLFSWKAFTSFEPPDEYKELSTLMVEYANHLPLALTVLGSLLRSKNTSGWVIAMDRLRSRPKKETFKKLKISFDSLNETDQRIFLDIACFFNGFDKDYVIQILDSCYFDSEYGINNLINISFLSIQHGRKLWMDDLLQEMGKNIVREESGNELRRQSRIWDTVDLYQILENQKGTNEVEAIVNDSFETKGHRFEALSSMKKLRLLKLSVGLPKKSDNCDEIELSNNLRYLDWTGFPYNNLASSFQPRNLVQLKLRDSNIKQLWFNGIKPLYNLKVMDLSFSPSFANFEDFTVVPNLETLNLQHCVKLRKIHPSIGRLKKLISLNLDGCTSLEELPVEINGLASLRTLTLVGCFNLKNLPDNLERLKSLRNLDIKDSSIKHLPSSIFLMENVQSVSSDDEEMIESAVRENIISYRITGKSLFPGSFCTFLTRLELSDCTLTGPEAFPEYFGKLVSLTYLDLSNNPLSVLPPEISGLSGLKYLSLEGCERIERLEPELLPSSLEVDPSERRYEDFKFVVPQSDNELPSWFINTSLTASISIKLDPSWCNSELIGFAMAFCFGANSSKEDNFSCRIRVPGSEYWETTMEVGAIKSRMSDHLCLLYSPCEDTLEFIQQLDPQSLGTLEFSFLGASDKHGLSCGPCGVRLISEKDIEELKILTSISQHSKLRRVGPIRRQHSTGLRGILDVDDNSESVEMQRYSHEDGPNPESNPSMLESTRFGVFRNYSLNKTKFLDK